MTRTHHAQHTYSTRDNSEARLADYNVKDVTGVLQQHFSSFKATVLFLQPGAPSLQTESWADLIMILTLILALMSLSRI